MNRCGCLVAFNLPERTLHTYTIEQTIYQYAQRVCYSCQPENRYPFGVGEERGSLLCRIVETLQKIEYKRSDYGVREANIGPTIERESIILIFEVRNNNKMDELVYYAYIFLNNSKIIDR